MHVFLRDHGYNDKMGRRNVLCTTTVYLELCLDLNLVGELKGVSFRVEYIFIQRDDIWITKDQVKVFQGFGKEVTIDIHHR